MSSLFLDSQFFFLGLKNLSTNTQKQKKNRKKKKSKEPLLGAPTFFTFSPPVAMRPLTEAETKTFFEKLTKYIGRNIKFLVDRKDEEYCFRLHKDRVYYISVQNMKMATNIDRKKLVSLGTCFGKFTKSGQFRIQITALDYLAQFAPYKVWVKPSQEMSFMYGNHVLKSGLGRITDNTPEHQGVVVFTMSDVPIGFGTTAKSTHQCRKTEPMAIVVYHQGDIGEYLREEGHFT